MIIGRETELDAAAGFLRAVPTGPTALVIEGEPGIGKTTLWLETLRTAETRGFRVLSARPAESEAKLSYAALADLAAPAFDEARAALPPPQERALEAVLLRTDEPTDPRTTATAVVALLSALARAGPVVVAVDDVQWLDRASERALEFTARRLPDLDGFSVAERLVDVSASSKIVFVSSRSVSSFRWRLATNPAWTFIAKSELSGEALKSAIG